jgi:hypothetical protein
MSLPEMDGLWSDVKARDAAEAATRATSGVAYKQQKTTD